MYSFGRKFKNNPLIGTFVKEDINAGLFEDVKDTASYSIYVTFVTKKELDLMKEKLNYFLIRKDELKYNFTGLIKHTLGMESEREDAYFCSQFVDTILRSSGKTYFNRHSSLVRPYDFARHKDFHFVSKGLLKNYDKNKVDYKVQQIFDKLYGRESTLESGLNVFNFPSKKNVTHVYFGLTEDEVKKGKIYYPKGRYDTKAVNVSLQGLRKFVNSTPEIKNLVKYYTVIPINKLSINEDISYDKEYDMIAVNLPIDIKITNVNKI